MRLIFGLGNPGRKYSLTRHNIGFIVVDSLAKKFKKDFKKDISTQAHISKLNLSYQICVLAKPMTFMNRCGFSLRRLINKYGFSLQETLVVCDDINLDLGRIRIRPYGSAGGHNGLSSIIENLGTTDFARLRVGIGKPVGPFDLSSYVLDKFSKKSESLIVKRVLKRAVECCECWLRFGIDNTMNKFNVKFTA